MSKQYEIPGKYLLILCVYGVFTFFLFCFVLFPKEKASRYALQLLSERLNCTLIAKDLRLGFPSSIEIHDLVITKKKVGADAPSPYLQIDTIQLKPKLRQLFLSRLVMLFNLQLYQGHLEGAAYFDLLHPTNLKEFHCLGQGIQLSSLKQVQELFSVQIRGEFSGQAKVKLEKDSLEKDGILSLSGDYSFEVTPGEIQIMSFPNFTFHQIKGEGSLGDGKVKIRSVHIQGDDLQAQVTGDLRLDSSDLTKSYLKSRVHLNLSQQLQERLGPLAGFLPRQNKEGINLSIRGNLNKLSFLPI